MNLKAVIATILEALGLLAVAGGVALVSIWAGVIVFGAGLVLFGVAMERGADPSAPAGPRP